MKKFKITFWAQTRSKYTGIVEENNIEDVRKKITINGNIFTDFDAEIFKGDLMELTYYNENIEEIADEEAEYIAEECLKS